MKIKDIIKNKPSGQTNNIVSFNFSRTLIENGVETTKTYNVSIPDTITRMLVGNYKLRKPVAKKSEESNFYSSIIPSELNNIASLYAYKWGNILDLCELKFNPLYNVDAYETTTNDYDTVRTVDKFGQDKTTMGFGTDTQTNNYGVDNTTNTYGQDKMTNVVGEQTVNATHKTNPFNDSDTNYTTDVNITNNGAHTDTNTRDSHIDTTSRSAHEDSITRASHTDTNTRDMHTDEHTTDTRTDLITIRRYGNIGVTMSGQMIKNTVESVDIESWQIILLDILKVIGKGY